MRLTITPILLLLVAFSPIWAEDEKPDAAALLDAVKLPTKVEDATSRMQLELDEARAAYNEAVNAAKAKAIKTIEREVKRNKDQLVGLALQREIDRINDMGAPLDFFGDPIVEKPEVHPVVGTWNMNMPLGGTEVWVFAADNTVTRGKSRGTWEIKENKVHVTWAPGKVPILNLPNGNDITGGDAKGRPIVGKRSTD